MKTNIVINKQVIEAKELDITGISYTDETSEKSDTLSLTCLQNAIKLKDIIGLQILKGKKKFNFGKFEVIKIKEDFMSKSFSIESNFLKNYSSVKSRSFSNIAIRTLVDTIAKEGGYQYKCNLDYTIEFVGQQEETNNQFLNRLSRRLGAYFSLKEDTILFLDKEKNTSPNIKNINPKNLSSLEIANSMKKKYKTCKITYHNTKENISETITVGDGEEPILEIQEIPRSKQDAIRIAKAKLISQKNIEGSFSLTLEDDDYMLFAGDRISLEDLRYNNTTFIVNKVTHNIAPAGYSISAEFTN